jgi:hypothetical protein
MKNSKALSQKDLDTIFTQPSYEALLENYPKQLLHVEDRMEHIVYVIGLVVNLTDGLEIFCFDYDNAKDGKDGNFNPAIYKENIVIRIAFNKRYKYQADLFMKIPVSYLVENFEAVIGDEIEKAMKIRSSITASA